MAYRKLSARGLRVLAVAFRPGVAREGITVADERDMTLAGFLAFVDPPREGAAASLAALRRDGVTVKVITGDNELVTRNICERVGIDANSWFWAAKSTTSMTWRWRKLRSRLRSSRVSHRLTRTGS